MLLTLSALASTTGRGVRVAVIDSGVHAAHPHVQGVWGGVGIDDDGRVHDDYVDRLGHGTAVTAVIREKAPDAEVYAIKVFDRELRATGPALVAALAARASVSARLANLSLGTENADHERSSPTKWPLRVAAGIAHRRRWPEGDRRWLPGSSPGRGRGDDGHARASRRVRDRSSMRRSTVAACGYPRPIPGVPPERNLQGVSFAVANASGLLARLLEGPRRA